MEDKNSVNIQKLLKIIVMNTINIRKMGMAFGLTVAFLYLGCFGIMEIVGREGSIKFFNSLIHGVDFSPVVRMNMARWEVLIGTVETFVLFWLIGACIAAFYNLQRSKHEHSKLKV